MCVGLGKVWPATSEYKDQKKTNKTKTNAMDARQGDKARQERSASKETKKLKENFDSMKEKGTAAMWGGKKEGRMQPCGFQFAFVCSPFLFPKPLQVPSLTKLYNTKPSYM